MCFPGGGDGTEETNSGRLLESGRGRRGVDTLVASPSRDGKQWPHRANEGEIGITNCPAGSVVGWRLGTKPPTQAIRRFGESRYGKPGRCAAVWVHRRRWLGSLPR